MPHQSIQPATPEAEDKRLAAAENELSGERALKLGFPESSCYKLRVPEVQTGVTIEYARSWRNW